MLKFIPVLAFVILTGCLSDKLDSPDACDSLTLVLNISDMKAESRATSTITDQINTLRVVIARPNGVIEVNRILRPLENVLTNEDLRFKISPDPHKWVFLISNEASMATDFDSFPNFDPDMLQNPIGAPEHPINATISSLPSSATSVPMSAVYRLGTSLDLADKISDGVYEIRYNLCLMRTVTKFTFNIFNDRKIPVDITEMGINHVKADHYYLFPRVMATDGTEKMHFLTAEGDLIKESGTDKAPIDESGSEIVSPFSEYFRTQFIASSVGNDYFKFSTESISITPSKVPIVIEHYYYESALPDDADRDKPYMLFVDFDGNQYITPLDNLSALPRNTHVVINMRFSNNDKILEIEVLPYFGVDLSPGFGKKDD